MAGRATASVHGTSTYLNKIKVLEVAEQDDGEEF